MRLSKLLVWVPFLFLIHSCSKLSKGDGKYGIRKAVIISESTYSSGLAKSKVTLQFDNYGKREYTHARTETYVNGLPQYREQFSVLEGEYLYSWNPETKQGSKYRYKDVLDPFKLSKEDFTEDMKKQFNFKELGTEEYLGKTCQVTSLNFDGVSGKMYAWENIILKSQVSSNGMSVETKAISIDESPDLDESLFVIPFDDIQFSEMTIPARPEK